MDNTDLLKLLWGVLASAWGLATIIRTVLIYLSWPGQRKRRIFTAVVHLIVTAFFIWQLTQPAPDEVTRLDLNRNWVNLLAAIWGVLEGIWGVYGMAERRARVIQRTRQETQYP